VLEFTVDLPTDPDTVWRLLTDPAGIAQWFAPQVEGSGEPGGTLTLSWGPEMRWTAKVASAERGRLVRWQDDFDAYQQLPRPPRRSSSSGQLFARAGEHRVCDSCTRLR
jgi:uncharacterized protein YndB with AHSA1/START domain